MLELKPHQFGMRHCKELAECEISQTCVCAMALNELIGSSCGKILHQGPTKKKLNTSGVPETADYYGVVFSPKGEVCAPFLLGDGKKGDFEKAIIRKAKYAHGYTCQHVSIRICRSNQAIETEPWPCQGHKHTKTQPTDFILPQVT